MTMLAACYSRSFAILGADSLRLAVDLETGEVARQRVSKIWRHPRLPIAGASMGLAQLLMDPFRASRAQFEQL